MGLILLLTRPDPLAIPRVRLDTHLVSITFPESDIAADRPDTLIVTAPHLTSIRANDPSTSIVAA